MPVAQATRHSRITRGYVFSLGLSLASIGKQPEGNLGSSRSRVGDFEWESAIGAPVYGVKRHF